ncbi:MAG: 4Fe-4S dicluster domain-containing protein [Bacillota bacterium]
MAAGNSPIVNRLQARPQPVFRQTLCIACGACAAACRAGALAMRPDLEKARVIWRFVPEACMGCGRCTRYCPTGAITIAPPEDELRPFKAVKETSFPLQKCSCCGHHYASALEIAHLATLVPDTFLNNCTACRRLRAARSLSLAYF